MVIRPFRFNIYLLFLAACLGLTGCQSTKSKEENEPATLRIHVESNPIPDFSDRITVLRTAPMQIDIEKTPILYESQIAAARILEGADGFALQIQFNSQGQHLLEQYSSSHARRRFAIRCQFRQSTNVFDRWLAAPYIANHITDGILAFTPDADRAEAECIVRGWNKVAGYQEPKPTAPAKKPTEVAK